MHVLWWTTWRTHSLLTLWLYIIRTTKYIFVTPFIFRIAQPGRSSVSQPASGRSRILDNAQFQLVSSATALIEFCRARWLAGTPVSCLWGNLTVGRRSNRFLLLPGARQANKRRPTTAMLFLNVCLYVIPTGRTDRCFDVVLHVGHPYSRLKLHNCRPHTPMHVRVILSPTFIAILVHLKFVTFHKIQCLFSKKFDVKMTVTFFWNELLRNKSCQMVAHALHNIQISFNCK